MPLLCLTLAGVPLSRGPGMAAPPWFQHGGTGDRNYHPSSEIRQSVLHAMPAHSIHEPPGPRREVLYPGLPAEDSRGGARPHLFHTRCNFIREPVTSLVADGSAILTALEAVHVGTASVSFVSSLGPWDLGRVACLG